MKLVEFDYDKCVGCGECITSCHEGALRMENGKPVVSDENLCDGLGDCIKSCRYDAIKIIDTDNKSVVRKTFRLDDLVKRTWPIKLELVGSNDSRFNNCDLVICADCVGYTYKKFNEEFNKQPIIIGCPKLTSMNYYEKLKAIIEGNNIKSITLYIMEVGCCKQLGMIVKNILTELKLDIPYKKVICSINGELDA